MDGETCSKLGEAGRRLETAGAAERDIGAIEWRGERAETVVTRLPLVVDWGEGGEARGPQDEARMAPLPLKATDSPAAQDDFGLRIFFAVAVA